MSVKNQQTKSKDILDKALTYLAGPIDDVEDDGVDWRQRMIKGFKKKKINLTVLDPTHKLGCIPIGEVGEEKQSHLYLKREGRFDVLAEMMKPTVRIDLREVDFIDFLIVRVDVSVHMCGSYHEIIEAVDEHKPILAIIEGGKKNAPSWLFGILDHNLMFNDEEECLEYLDAVNRGIMPLDNKWVLIRKYFKGVLDK